MELKLQPNPEINIAPPDKGIVSKKEYFVEKTFEKIEQYFFPGYLIRNWKPKAQLIYPQVSDETAIQYECDFNRDIQNCFVEDFAEEVYLRSPPPCFVIIGKSGPNVGKLGQDIAKEYGSVLIQVENIVNQVIKTKTETSALLDRVLRLGVSITLNFILALLSYVAHTPEARHRGYVLCGLPCPPLSYDLSIEQQLNYLFSWENKPTVLINVFFEDEDLILARTNQRCELETVGDGKRMLIRPNIFEEEDEEEEIDDYTVLPPEDEVRSPEPDINVSPSRFWVQLPRDEESQVWSELELFNVSIKPMIDLFRARVDPQYFLTADSRVKNEFEMVKARLRLLPIWKVPIPFPFIRPKQKKAIEVSKNEEEDEEELEEEEEGYESDEEETEVRQVIGKSPQTAFLSLFYRKTISPKYRWELSHFNYVCPVALRERQIVEGKSEFAVVFMKYIYFLRDEESMMKFLKNPRPYVLPIRPMLLYRFIILGYPFSGKTTLARHLSTEFSLPLIDVRQVLKMDLEMKKNVYQEFCRQKAERREIIRLTAQAWQDWRMEEEQRVTLIEEWIMYIQTLLSQRIEQFYSPEASDQETKVQSHSPSTSEEHFEMHAEESTKSSGKKKESLEVRGVPIAGGTTDPHMTEYSLAISQPTPSVRIMQALKNEDYDFNEKGLEVEANLFFSSLWNTYSSKQEGNVTEKFLKSDEEEEESEGEDRVGFLGKKSDEESFSVNWCSLLPPQSLSSFLLEKKSYTTRQRRRPFLILLEAASKAYWAPSALKTEFAKWRLPCFMDIPLCEIFLDNPFLLLKYCPEWLKERPLIPDPIDPLHPSVIEAGRLSFLRAGIVTVSHNQEEVIALLGDAIERAKRDGTRVTGEVITPGGWVIDNMVLDYEVWEALGEKLFANYVFILTESDPAFRRIINHWCELQHQSSFTDIRSSELVSNGSSTDDTQSLQSGVSLLSARKRTSAEFDLVRLLWESWNLIEHGNKQLDEIFYNITEALEDKKVYIPPISVDSFSHGILKNTLENWFALPDDTLPEEGIINAFTNSSYNFFLNCRELSTFNHELPLGVELEIFTNKVLNFFHEKQPEPDPQRRTQKIFKDDMEFFLYLLTLASKLERIKEFLVSSDEDIMIREIDITNKSESELFTDILKELNTPFIKKPRELEDFEREEIYEELEKENAEKNKEFEEEVDGEGYETEAEPNEDIRIYGESGPFCIVNLERNILLQGKPEFMLRYYGKLYLFYNQDAKDKFVEDPEKYAPYYSPIRCLPPVRIFVMGPIGCGKTSLARAVSNQCSVHFVNYISFLNESVVPHLEPQCDKFKALTSQKLLTPNYNQTAQIAKEKFMAAPRATRQFWLENPVYEKNEDNVIANLQPVCQDPVPKDFPQLNYEVIESIYDEESTRSDVSDSKSDPEVPAAPFTSMRELEVMLEDYIQCKSDLSDYCIERSLRLLYDTIPFASQGFILDGFPLRAFDVQRMTENNWIPDLVLEVTLPEDEIVARNVDDKMELWEAKKKQEEMEEKLLEEALTTVQNTLISIRRNELVAEKRGVAQITNEMSSEIKIVDLAQGVKQNGESRLSFGFEEFGEAEDEVEDALAIEAQLNAEIDKVVEGEFPPLEFNPVFESYESGRARVTSDLTENYRRDMQELDKIKTALRSHDIPWLEIDGTEHPERNRIDIFLLLNALKKRINQRGEFAFTLSMETAEKLLLQGYYFLSKFGRMCPVQAYRMKNPINMFRPFEKRGKITPVAYRNYIYFVSGENEKTHFINDPIKYTFNEPHHPNIPVRIAVVGPPKCGKSTLSSRLGLTFGLKVITMGDALRFVVEQMPGTMLERTINDYLKRGCFLPLSLKIEALMACLNDTACATQGFVFDGIPFDAAMAQSLAEKEKLPFVILSLVGDAYFGKTNREKLDLKTFRLPYKQRVNLDSRYKEWDNTYKRFVQWNRDTYSNLYELNAKASVVNIFYQAYDIIRKSFFGILYYVEHCVTDKALPLEYLCVSQHEYEIRKSMFNNNCPVCWVELERLNGPTNPPARSGLVQHLNYFYWVCPKHMKKFLKQPKAYLPPNGEVFPTLLPKIISKRKFDAAFPPLKLHGYGRCPVTRTDIPGALDWEGSWDYAVSYGDEVFLCKNEQMLTRFLARPWKYCTADTQFEMDRTEKSNAVVELGPPKVTSLPRVGFLEQTVADLIHKALQVLGIIRPVYPNLSATCVGCNFLGLYLKVHNKKNKTPHLESQYLDFMLFHCRAYRFRVPLERVSKEKGEGDFKAEQSEMYESESSEDSFNSAKGLSCKRGSESASFDSYWKDFEAQREKNIWSAKHQSKKFTDMWLTENDELREIPEVPKFNVVLGYQTYSLRVNPLPPVIDCITFIYSCKPGLQLPEKFNVNSLYQPLPLFTSPYGRTLPFNPNKHYPDISFVDKAEEGPSELKLWKGKRTISDSTADVDKDSDDANMDPMLRLMVERFVPRFQLLDVMTSVGVPAVPKVVEEEPIVFNPHRDYSYTLLMAHFFRLAHVLRCYEWDESLQYFEHSSLLERNVGLCNAQSQFLFSPKVSPSLKSRKSIASRQEAFETSCWFYGQDDAAPSSSTDTLLKEQASLVNFIQAILLDKMDKIFYRVSTSALSYDSYESSILVRESLSNISSVVLVREIYPFPPLLWDISSRPYYAYLSISPIFEVPQTDEIAHERNFSLLDGIKEGEGHFRFRRFPGWVHPVQYTIDFIEAPTTPAKQGKNSCLRTTFPVYDFFSLEWTSFMTYPFSWAYNLDISVNFTRLNDSKEDADVEKDTV